MKQMPNNFRRVKFIWKYVAPVLAPLFCKLFGFHRTVYKPVEEPFRSSTIRRIRAMSSTTTCSRL